MVGCFVVAFLAYDVSVNLLFLGVPTATRHRHLETLDRTRYVKVTTLQEAKGPELAQWIKQAGRTPGWT